MKKVIPILILLVLIASCGSRKGSSTVQNEKEVSGDTLIQRHELFRNMPINDVLRIFVPPVRTARPDCDSICNAALIEVLKGINTEKRSGDNSYKVIYDELQRMIVINAEMAETISEFKENDHKKYFLKTVTTTTEIPVKYVPRWIQVLAWIGGFAIAFVIYRIIRIFL